MATLIDITVSALINLLSTFAILLAFALLKIKPINERVYFCKWYIDGMRSNPSNGGVVGFNFLNWMPQALKMSEDEIISHAGLDSAVFLRIFTLGLKIFGPIATVALVVLIPVNVSSGALDFGSRDLVFNILDKLSISNIRPKSYRFFIHISMEYLFSFWTFYMLYKEYGIVTSMRLKFLASQGKRVEQFTVLVRNVPRVPGCSISDSIENFFKRNHPDQYLCHRAVYNVNKFAILISKRDRLQNWLDYNQLKFERHPEKRPTCKNGFLGLLGRRVDSIDFYKEQINELDKKLIMELENPKAITTTAFVSFKSRWRAAVCAQTQQSENPTMWLTDWAPEARDIYWNNLSILNPRIQKLVVSISVFALVFFYMIPVAFVQSLTDLEVLESVVPSLKLRIEWSLVKPLLQGFVSGLVLKTFLYILPSILMFMSKIEGHAAVSVLERRTSAKYYYFMLVNVFLGSIVTGTALEQLHSFLQHSPIEFAKNIGRSIPMKATFFITYIMVDEWSGIASEILRLKSLVIFHLKKTFIVKTEGVLEKAMNPRGIDFPEILPRLQFYFLLGIVYMVVTPILLPFILVFFGFAYFVYRHQVINVYNQQYESAAAFWPHVHGCIIANLLISQLLLMGLLSTKKAAYTTPFLIVLLILTLTFHKYCKNRFEPAFKRYPLEEALNKDLEDRAAESDANIRSFLADAYLHPIFNSFKEVELVEARIDQSQTHIPSPSPRDHSSPSPPP